VHPAFFKAHLLDPLGCKDTDPGGTSGGALTTSMDLAKVAQMLLNGGSYGNMRFMSPESVRLMAPQEGRDRFSPTRIFAGASAQKFMIAIISVHPLLGTPAPMGLSSISIPNEIWW